MKWCVVFAVACIGDVVLTTIGLGLGGREFNPIMDLPLWSLIAVKAFAVMFLVCRYLQNKKALVPKIASGLTWSVVVWNSTRIMAVI